MAVFHIYFSLLYNTESFVASKITDSLVLQIFAHKVYFYRDAFHTPFHAILGLRFPSSAAESGSQFSLVIFCHSNDICANTISFLFVLIATFRVVPIIQSAVYVSVFDSTCNISYNQRLQ